MSTLAIAQEGHEPRTEPHLIRQQALRNQRAQLVNALRLGHWAATGLALALASSRARAWASNASTARASSVWIW